MEVDIAHGVEVGRSVPKAAWASDFAVASDNSSGNPLGPECRFQYTVLAMRSLKASASS
jgi:hypothetical protein